MLTLATTVTLFQVKAGEVWLEATAPVITRTATKARTIFFMEWPLFRTLYAKLLIKLLLSVAAPNYLVVPIPQALGSSGAHIGIGNMLTLATATLFWVEGEEVWVEATAPVTTRTATRARTSCFIVGYP
jgi:hypothetical protein